MPHTSYRWITLVAVLCLGTSFVAGYTVGKRAAKMTPVPASPDPIAAIKIEKDIRNQLLTTPPPAKPVDAAKQPRDLLQQGPALSGEYTLQVSSFPTKDEAQAFAAGLTRKGYKPFTQPAAIPGKGTWYRVRVGRFTLEADARAAKEVLAAADIPAWVVKSE